MSRDWVVNLVSSNLASKVFVSQKNEREFKSGFTKIALGGVVPHRFQAQAEWQCQNQIAFLFIRFICQVRSGLDK